MEKEGVFKKKPPLLFLGLAQFQERYSIFSEPRKLTPLLKATLWCGFWLKDKQACLTDLKRRWFRNDILENVF